LGLICRRIADYDLRDYTSFAHYFNLGSFVIVIGLALGAWFANGHSFAGFHAFAVGFVSFSFRQPMDPSVAAPVILGAVLVAYIPWTHMAHFFMKYFLYHNIRWDDEPMIGAGTAEARLQGVLNYKPTWAAGHVRGDGQKTWADLAVHNPARKQPKE
jgi:nitrate reductase gamma subunit